MGKSFIFIGLTFIIIGTIILIGSKIGLGKLPGDIFIQKGNNSFYFPIVTCTLISIILSLILNIFSK